MYIFNLFLKVQEAVDSFYNHIKQTIKILVTGIFFSIAFLTL